MIAYFPRDTFILAQTINILELMIEDPDLSLFDAAKKIDAIKDYPETAILDGINISCAYLVNQSYLHISEGLKSHKVSNKRRLLKERIIKEYLGEVFPFEILERYSFAEIFQAIRNSFAHTDLIKDRRAKYEYDDERGSMLWKLKVIFNKDKPNEEILNIKMPTQFLFDMIGYQQGYYALDDWNLHIRDGWLSAMEKDPANCYKYIQFKDGKNICKWDDIYQQTMWANYYKTMQKRLKIESVNIRPEDIQLVAPLKNNAMRNSIKIEPIYLILTGLINTEPKTLNGAFKYIKNFDDEKGEQIMAEIHNTFELVNPLYCNMLYLALCFKSKNSVLKMCKEYKDFLPSKFFTEDGKIDRVKIMKIRNAIIHGTYYFNFNNGFELYDGEGNNLSHLMTIEYSDIARLSNLAINEYFKNRNNAGWTDFNPFCDNDNEQESRPEDDNKPQN